MHPNRKFISVARLSCEILLQSGRPLTVFELVGGIRECFTCNLTAERLVASLSKKRRFTWDGHRYGLTDFGWKTGSSFSYIWQ
jgi:hypothetical protein